MSANNAIIILGTVKNFRTDSDGIDHHSDPYKVYRVAHVLDWENYNWYKENQVYNLGYFLYYNFHHSIPYENINDAVNRANNLYNLIGNVEYGVIIEDTEYMFPGD